MKAWVLTFNRPVALNRLVTKLLNNGFEVCIFNNYPPNLKLTAENVERLDTKNIVVNYLNSPESNSWCARSWNTMFMKTFETDEEAIFIQDDTDIVEEGFRDWIEESKHRFDFIWGPAGDQFFYTKWRVFQEAGWWDERYIGCYCGDADWLNKVYQCYSDRDRLSIQDSHNWGFTHNPCFLSKHVVTTYEAKTVDEDYDNQHWQMERLHDCTDDNNPTIKQSQMIFYNRWGEILDSGTPLNEKTELFSGDIDWYPWFTKKYNVRIV